MLKINQDDLAFKLGVSFQQVQNYEKGSNRITAVHLAEIAAAIDTIV